MGWGYVKVFVEPILCESERCVFALTACRALFPVLFVAQVEAALATPDRGLPRDTPRGIFLPMRPARQGVTSRDHGFAILHMPFVWQKCGYVGIVNTKLAAHSLQRAQLDETARRHPAVRPQRGRLRGRADTAVFPLPSWHDVSLRGSSHGEFPAIHLSPPVVPPGQAWPAVVASGSATKRSRPLLARRAEDRADNAVRGLRLSGSLPLQLCL